MIFETLDDKLAMRGQYVSPSGSPYLDEYEYQVDKKGVKELVKTDRKENVHARIQADADSCDINKLMARFALGDTSALDQNSGFYGDVTKLPDNYADLFNRVEACKQFFAELPVDLKQLFDNSYEVFFTEFGTDAAAKKYEIYNSRFVNTQYDVPDDSPKHTEGFTEVER